MGKYTPLIDKGSKPQMRGRAHPDPDAVIAHRAHERCGAIRLVALLDHSVVPPAAQPLQGRPLRACAASQIV